MRNTFLVQKVNFYVSVFFILSFGLFSTSLALRIAHLDDPITGIEIPVVEAADINF